MYWLKILDKTLLKLRAKYFYTTPSYLAQNDTICLFFKCLLQATFSYILCMELKND